MPISENAKKLLLQVKEHILAEPNRLRMSNWVQEGEPGSPVWDSSWESAHNVINDSAVQVMPACGTAACIAGWMVILTGKMEHCKSPGEIADCAAAMLEIGDEVDNEFASEHLFYTSKWPVRFHNDYYFAESVEAKAKVAADRIDYFVATGE